MIVRVGLPPFLRMLAQIEGSGELRFAGAEPVTVAAVLDALEDRSPALRGAIRDRVTGARRPFLRFFACQEDWSHTPIDTPLPDAVAEGREPLLIIGAIAGG